MLNKTSNFAVIFLVTLFITAGPSCTQEENSREKSNSDMKDHNMKHETMMDSSKTMGSDDKDVMKDNKSIVHEGTIDLAEIDENGDGKVYQDQMCWNVVSDEAGKCPLCGMRLKEVTLNEAKFNLINNGFEVK